MSGCAAGGAGSPTETQRRRAGAEDRNQPSSCAVPLACSMQAQKARLSLDGSKTPFNSRTHLHTLSKTQGKII